MKTLISYLLQSSTILAVLYMVYGIFLSRETYFKLNRIYLVVSAILALFIPVFRFEFNYSETVRSAVIYLDPFLVTPARIGKMTDTHFSFFMIAGTIYFTGVMFSMMHFLSRIITLYNLVSRSQINRQAGLNIIFVDKQVSPFSFFNLVFLSRQDTVQCKMNTILDHELIHIRQFHSLDILLFEILKIILWFNPFAWFIGKSIKTIHEFLADEGVLQTGYNPKDYQHLLLQMTSGYRISGLSNNFNFSLIKNRIVMMTKSRSAVMAKGKVLIAIPALLATVFLFSMGTLNSLKAQDKSKESPKPATTTTTTTTKNTPGDNTVYKVVEKQPSYPGGEEGMISFLRENIKYPENAKKNNIQGKVFVTFVVKADGTVSDVKILRGIGGGCDEEAARVVKMMPKWVPGEEKGKPVNVQFNLPIKFALDNKEKKEEPKK